MDEFEGKPVRWSEDAGAADWIVGRLHRTPADAPSDVGAFLPEGFSAYARILHTAWRGEPWGGEKIRWAEFARRGGVALSPRTRFEELQSGEAMQDIEAPLEGTLPCDELSALVDILGASTSTPGACWFGIWEGYGWMRGPPAIVELVAHEAGRAPDVDNPPNAAPPGRGRPARVRLPDRSLFLHEGPIEAAAAFCRPPTWQSPNLWWPDDRAWCVASEVDFRSTYLGGADELIARVRRDPRLEALPVRPSGRGRGGICAPKTPP